MQRTDVLVGFRRPDIGREIFWLSSLNLKDIPYNSDFHKTLDRVHFACVLSKGAFISKSVATLGQKVGLICLKVTFYFSYSGHACNCRLKIANHLKIIIWEGKKLNIV